jgi:hypothetical protein
MHMSLTHRLQVLLDEHQHARLAERAASEGRSVGALVREAIDLAWVAPDTRKQQALDQIFAAPSMPVPEPEQLRVELDEARAGKFA